MQKYCLSSTYSTSWAFKFIESNSSETSRIDVVSFISFRFNMTYIPTMYFPERNLLKSSVFRQKIRNSRSKQTMSIWRCKYSKQFRHFLYGAVCFLNYYTSDISMFYTSFLYQNDNKEEPRANNICLISVSFQTFENSSKKAIKTRRNFQ